MHIIYETVLPVRIKFSGFVSDDVILFDRFPASFHHLKLAVCRMRSHNVCRKHGGPIDVLSCQIYIVQNVRLFSKNAHGYKPLCWLIRESPVALMQCTQLDIEIHHPKDLQSLAMTMPSGLSHSSFKTSTNLPIDWRSTDSLQGSSLVTQRKVNQTNHLGLLRNSTRHGQQRARAFETNQQTKTAIGEVRELYTSGTNCCETKLNFQPKGADCVWVWV